MILGIGTDIISIERIENLLKEFGDKFVNRILSEEEIAIYNGKKSNKINYLAKRFAGKEAFSKAYGTGIGSEISFKDISILNDEKGKPYIKIIEKSNISKFFSDKKIYVSLSDDKISNTALAFCVIES